MTKKTEASENAIEAAFNVAVETLIEAQAEIIENAPEAPAEAPRVGQAPLDPIALANALGDKLPSSPVVSAAEKARDEKAEETANHILLSNQAFEDVLDNAETLWGSAVTPEDQRKLLVDARFKSIEAESDAIMCGADYAELLGRVFHPLWPTWSRDDVAKEPPGSNLAPIMTAFFAEKDDYYSNYRRLRARFSKRPNPRPTWQRFEEYQTDALNRAIEAKAVADAIARGEEPPVKAVPSKGTGGKGNAKTPLQAVAAYVPPVYLKVMKALGKLPADQVDDRLTKIGEGLHAALKLALTDSELQALAEKF
jgi:hypothetical protein